MRIKQLRLAPTMLAIAVIAALPVIGMAQDSDTFVRKVGFFGGKRYCQPCCPPCDTTAAPPSTTEPAPADSTASPDFSMSSLETADSTQTLAPNMLGDSFGGHGLSGDISKLSLSRHKVADNNSPIPRGRLFYSYNYFQDAFHGAVDVHRNLGGAEIPLFGGDASIEIRNHLNTFSTIAPSTSEGGNLVTTLKAVAFRSNALLVSGGLSIGWPIGPTPEGFPGGNAVVAPYFGFLSASGDSNLFFQGFQQLDIPTEGDDQAILQTDIAAGIWLRRNAYSRFITGIAPTMELHLYTPVGDAPAGTLQGLEYNDILNATMGTTFILRDRVSLAVALSMPLSTRKDYDFEGQIQLNWFFGRGR